MRRAWLRAWMLGLENFGFRGQGLFCLPPRLCLLLFRRTPQPVIVTIRDERDYIRALLYSCYTTITRWGVLLSYSSKKMNHRDPNLEASIVLISKNYEISWVGLKLFISLRP